MKIEYFLLIILTKTLTVFTLPINDTSFQKTTPVIKSTTSVSLKIRILLIKQEQNKFTLSKYVITQLNKYQSDPANKILLVNI